MKITEIINGFEVKIPTTVGRQRVLNYLAETVCEAIREDIVDILSKASDVSDYESLRVLHLKINELSKQPKTGVVCKILNKNLRFLTLVLRNHHEQLGLTVEHQDRLLEILDEISRQIGIVPRLNDTVFLPAKHHLPPQYDQTIGKWSKIVWRTPGRVVTSGAEGETERLGFFIKESERHRIASVRLHLIELDRNPKNGKEALSYADADFYDIGNLHADHLQSSDDILSRQLELIEAMNLDPVFRDEMLAKDNAANTGYFLVENDEIFGSKKFYMEYHNCIGNLWLISAAENTGTGKGKDDCIAWLEEQELFGKNGFFEAIGGKDSIQRDRVLLVTKEGRFLADVARIWFREKYTSEIDLGSFMSADVVEVMKRRVVETSAMPRGKQRKKQQRRDLAASAIAAEVAGLPPASPVDDDSSGGDSDDTKMTEDNLRRVRAMVVKERMYELVKKTAEEDEEKCKMTTTSERKKRKRSVDEEKSMDEEESTVMQKTFGMLNR